MINNNMKPSPNSRYAVHYRSPKPLRASHTRNTLSEMPKPAFGKEAFLYGLEFIKWR